MSLRYADRFPRGARKPDCYGRDAYFNEDDSDCQRCDFFHGCDDEVCGRKRETRSVARREKTQAPTNRRGPEGRTHAGVILEGETAVERFGRDCLTGACRGAAWEAYEFFTYFRF